MYALSLLAFSSLALSLLAFSSLALSLLAFFSLALSLSALSSAVIPASHFKWRACASSNAHIRLDCRVTAFWHRFGSQARPSASERERKQLMNFASGL